MGERGGEMRERRKAKRKREEGEHRQKINIFNDHLFQCMKRCQLTQHAVKRHDYKIRKYMSSMKEKILTFNA